MLFDGSLINFILWIFKEIKWNVKVGLLEVTLMNFILQVFQGDQMEGESGVTLTIIDERHSLDMKRDQMEG